jgi:hypothetical protein
MALFLAAFSTESSARVRVKVFRGKRVAPDAFIFLKIPPAKTIRTRQSVLPMRNQPKVLYVHASPLEDRFFERSYISGADMIQCQGLTTRTHDGYRAISQ